MNEGTTMTATKVRDQHELYEELCRVYDLYRTVRMNREYYADRLQFCRFWNRTLEIVATLGTSGAIGAWALWKGEFGAVVWQVIVGVVAVVNILKPIFQLPRLIEKYSKLWAAYHEMAYDFDAMVSEIRIKKENIEGLEKFRATCDKRMKELATHDDHKAKLQKYQDLVELQIPVGSLWVPGEGEEGTADGRSTAGEKGA